MQDQGTSNWYEANDLLSNASNHDTNGAKFKDWRLPTKRELNLIFDEIDTSLNANYYWSSTEDDNNFAWGQYFLNGNQTPGYKPTTYSVRAVRAF